MIFGGSLHDRSGQPGFRPEPVPTAYSERRDPDLPWGYWLRETAAGSRVRDDEGREWTSVRHAFLVGRLGIALPEQQSGEVRFLRSGHGALEEQVETLIAVLSVFGRRVGVSEREAGGDVLGNARGAWEFYKGVLVGHGLAATVRDGLWRDAVLTDEGRAALLMLKVTRPPELDRMAPGRATVDLATDGRDYADLVAPGFDLDALPVAFARERVGPAYAVTLIDRRAGRRGMPLARTIWTTSFPARAERDLFYGWLVARADRWGAWADLVHNGGAAALSERLLSTYVSSIDWTAPAPLALEHHAAA